MILLVSEQGLVITDAKMCSNTTSHTLTNHINGNINGRHHHVMMHQFFKLSLYKATGIGCQNEPLKLPPVDSHATSTKETDLDAQIR